MATGTYRDQHSIRPLTLLMFWCLLSTHIRRDLLIEKTKKHEKIVPDLYVCSSVSRGGVSDIWISLVHLGTFLNVELAPMST
jgi:hypothetical protein